MVCRADGRLVTECRGFADAVLIAHGYRQASGTALTKRGAEERILEDMYS
jgi:hypothetical protein